MSKIYVRPTSSGQRMMATIELFQKDFSKFVTKKQKVRYLNELNIHWGQRTNTDTLDEHGEVDNKDINVFYDYFSPDLESLSNCSITKRDSHEQIVDFWEDIESYKFDEIDYEWIRFLFNPTKKVKGYLNRLLGKDESNVEYFKSAKQNGLKTQMDLKRDVLCYFRGWTNHAGPPIAGGNHPSVYTMGVDSMGLDDIVLMTDNYFWRQWFLKKFKKKYKIFDLSSFLTVDYEEASKKMNIRGSHSDKFNTEVNDGIHKWYAKLLFMSMFDHHVLSSGSHTTYLICHLKNSIKNTIFVDWELNHNFYNTDKNLKCKKTRYNFSEDI